MTALLNMDTDKFDGVMDSTPKCDEKSDILRENQPLREENKWLKDQ